MNYNSTPENNTTQNISRKPFVGITLQQYAESKKLPVDFLQSLHVGERMKKGVPRIMLPYFDSEGKKTGTRMQQSLNGSSQLIWQNNNKPSLYGLWRMRPLHDCKENGGTNTKIILVQGESNALTLWYYGYPALGIPGVTAWQSDWQKYIECREVFVWQEPDEIGRFFIEKIGRDIQAINILQPPENRKNISECHIAGDNIPELIPRLVESAIPFSDIQDERNKKEMEEISLGAIAFGKKDILEEVINHCRGLGVVGEEKNLKLIYVAITSRVLEKPISLAIKGVSSAGKSHILKNVLPLFPKSAYFDTSSMSDKALFYTDEEFEHRFLIFFENAGLSSEFLNYIIRSLLSEGRIKHMTVDGTEHGNQGKTLEKKGPTGFITTTTKSKLHKENETRLLSIEISDDPGQTRKIMQSHAKNAMGNTDTTTAPKELMNYQLWIEKLGKKEVVIPYAGILAERIKPVDVRLRRDFEVLLNTIKTIAILYQQQRETDENGCIIALLEDYQVAYELVSDCINQGVEKSVKPIVRETVLIVKEILNSEDPNLVGTFIDKSGNRRHFVDNKTLSSVLGLHSSSASRRVDQALALGYLENLETQSGKQSKLVLGNQMPEDDSILPSPGELKNILDAPSDSSAIVQSPKIERI